MGQRFALPIIDYVAYRTSDISSGIKNTQIDTKVTKRNLFISVGILWSSIGSLIVCLTLGKFDYLIFGAAFVALLSWHFILKLLIKYVFTL